MQCLWTSWLVALDSWWKFELNNGFGVVIGLAEMGAVIELAVRNNRGGSLRQLELVAIGVVMMAIGYTWI